MDDSPPMHEHDQQPEGWGPVIAIVIIVVLIVAGGVYFYATRGHQGFQPAAGAVNI